MADDHELRERIHGRDASAFEPFYRDNAGRLCACFRQIVGNVQTAEDVMQESFTQIWRSPNAFGPSSGRCADIFSESAASARRKADTPLSREREGIGGHQRCQVSGDLRGHFLEFIA